ncbi:MAG TPA: hypothetical protein VG650_01345 [Mycobacteriales bacterium]|nr:hypothetical protein [Mycobacteriales bacterium]
MKRIPAVLLLLPLVAAGCSIKSSTPNAYHLAEQACNTNGQAAVSYAQQAAKLDPQHYGQLATDEAALAANVNAQSGAAGQNDLGNLAGVTGQEGTGPGSSYQVLLDCKNISLQLLPGQ